MQTTKMVRDEPMHEGGPTECDVHPDEVGNMIEAGWKQVKSAPKHSVKKTQKAKSKA